MVPQFSGGASSFPQKEDLHADAQPPDTWEQLHNDLAARIKLLEELVAASICSYFEDIFSLKKRVVNTFSRKSSCKYVLDL